MQTFRPVADRKRVEFVMRSSCVISNACLELTLDGVKTLHR